MIIGQKQSNNLSNLLLNIKSRSRESHENTPLIRRSLNQFGINANQNQNTNRSSNPNKISLGHINIKDLLEVPEIDNTLGRKRISKLNDDYRSLLIIEPTQQLKDEYGLDKEKLLKRKFKPLLS